MEKVKMKIVSIEEEPAKNGGMHLRIKAKSDGKIFTFGVKEEDYLDESSRRRFHQSWIQTIHKAQIHEKKSKEQVTKDKEKVHSLVGEEVEESEY